MPKNLEWPMNLTDEQIEQQIVEANERRNRETNDLSALATERAVRRYITEQE